MKASTAKPILLKESIAKHPKCLGEKIWTDCGYEFTCGYGSKVDCGECKYGFGRKNPEAKINQFKD